jgi:phage terminase small subunit
MREGPAVVTCRPGHSPKFPDFEPGNQLARRHGVFAADATDEARQVVADLLSGEDIERYPAVALVFAEVWIRWRRALADIDRRGMVLGDGVDAKPHPLLSYASRFEATLLDLSGRFGLDPRSEAGLARDRADATRSVADLEGVRASGRAARLAAEARHAALPAGWDDGEGADGIGAEAGAEALLDEREIDG